MEEGERERERQERRMKERLEYHTNAYQFSKAEFKVHVITLCPVQL